MPVEPVEPDEPVEPVEPGKYRTDVYVRWSDQDINGHVNNARVATLLEEARIAWRSNAAGRFDSSVFDTPPLVASATLNYRRPIEFGFALTVELWVQRIGSKSYTLAYEGRQDGALVLDATSVMVQMATGEGRARALNDGERQYLAQCTPVGLTPVGLTPVRVTTGAPRLTPNA